MRLRSIVLCAGLWALVQGLQAQVPAATGSAGPYYATPSWDQQLPSATRFITLANWGGQAVLDRETGLVWQITLASEAETAVKAHQICQDSKVGNRGGWRLPTIQELMRTMVARSDGYVIVDSPFVFLASMAHFGVFGIWSSTSINTSFNPPIAENYYAYMQNRIINAMHRSNRFNYAFEWAVWCVQSPDAGGPAIL
jgi:hypothetical protein